MGFRRSVCVQDLTLRTSPTVGTRVGRTINEHWQPTSNCHLSTCSPVSLLVMTTTSLEILPPTIHLLSCDMIFLMYDLT